MMKKKVCKLHGSYDGDLGKCPRHSIVGQRRAFVKLHEVDWSLDPRREDLRDEQEEIRKRGDDIDEEENPL